MSAEPLTREERDRLQDPRRWGVTHQRWEATVQEVEERLKFVAAQWKKEVELERERADRLAEALDDAIELADEGWSYASDYFREKWNYVGEADALRAILAVRRSKSADHGRAS